MDNKNTPSDVTGAKNNSAGTNRRNNRRPLVLPEEDYPVRKRPAVSLDEVQLSDAQQRRRPAVDPNAIQGSMERHIHDGRITGEKHSGASTAAPVRTRTPEQNRGVTNGLPTRRANLGSGTGAVSGTVKGKGRQTFIALIIAAVCVIVMMSVVVFAVNRVYQQDTDRPADFMDTEPTGELSGINDIADAETNEPESTDTTMSEETDEEFSGESAEPQPVDTDTETGTGDAESEPQPEETAAPEPVRFTVTLQFYNRDPITVTTESITVGELLDVVGYEMKDSDRMYIDTESYITEDTTINVDTVEYKSVTETVEIPYESVVNELQTIPRGQKNVQQYGENGSKTRTYTVECVNGQEISRTLSDETVTKYPVSEIYDIGVGGVLTGADGNTYSYSYYRVVPATYYDIEGITWAGTYASENTIATDFDFLPLGTRVYVKNDSFDFGVRTVEDTGTMVNDYEIDIWLSDSNPQKAAFAQIGYHNNMVIYYLD